MAKRNRGPKIQNRTIVSLSRHVRGKYPNFPWDLHLNCIAAHMDNFFLRSPSFLLAFYEAVYHKSSLYYCPKYKCVFSVFFILEGFLILEKMQQHRFSGGFLVFLELYETHCIGYTCVTPQNTVAVSRAAYCRIQTFLMDLSPGFYEALPSADLKTTH